MYKEYITIPVITGGNMSGMAPSGDFAPPKADLGTRRAGGGRVPVLLCKDNRRGSEEAAASLASSSPHLLPARCPSEEVFTALPPCGLILG